MEKGNADSSIFFDSISSSRANTASYSPTVAQASTAVVYVKMFGSSPFDRISTRSSNDYAEATNERVSGLGVGGRGNRPPGEALARSIHI